jgi:hypothetical protein
MLFNVNKVFLQSKVARLMAMSSRPRLFLGFGTKLTNQDPSPVLAREEKRLGRKPHR